MKVGILTDTHGSVMRVEEVLNFFQESGVELLLHLGDVLAHGPRNPLPPGYAPLKLAERILAYPGVKVFVRGNCDSAVDEMVLGLPMTDFAVVGGYLFLHGHWEELKVIEYAKRMGVRGVVRGHLHRFEVKEVDSVSLVTLSSLSLPRNSPPSVGLLDGDELRVLDADGFVEIGVVRGE